eukprot:6214139-Heterocapsa_arctica.AAC.1
MSMITPSPTLLLDDRVDHPSSSLSFRLLLLFSSLIRAVDFDLLSDYLFLVLLVQPRRLLDR